MSEERLEEIQDSVDFQREFLLANNLGTLSVDEEQELIDEIERLNNIINELESFINMALEIYDNVDLPTLRMIKDKIKELKENDNV